MSLRRLLAPLTVALAVAACASPEGRAPAQERPTELVLWHAYRGDERLALEHTVDAWDREHPGVTVRVLSVPYDAFVDKLSLAVPKGNGPDLFIFAHDRLGDWAERGLLEPLGFLADEALLDRFQRSTLDALVLRQGGGDELYGLPLNFKCLALYYDRTLVPEPATTTEALIAQGKALRARDPRIWGIAWELDSLFFHAPWLHGFGGSVYEGAGDALALERPAAAESVRFVRRLRDEAKLIPPEVTSALSTTLFRAHQLAYVVSGPWFRAELEGVSDWGVVPLPVVSETGQPARPFLGVEGLFLSRRSANKAQAFDLMKSVTSDESALIRFGTGGQLVANVEVYSDPHVSDDAFAQAFRAQAARAVPLSNRPHMRRVWVPTKDALSAAIVHGEPAEAALRKAVEEIARGQE